MKTEFVEIVLTCASWQEAQKIADAVLGEHLIAAAEFLPVKPKHRGQGKLEEVEGVKLIMQTIEGNFAKIEAMVKKLHSYDTPNLHAIPIAEATEEVRTWLSDTTGLTS